MGSSSPEKSGDAADIFPLFGGKILSDAEIASFPFSTFNLEPCRQTHKQALSSFDLRDQYI
jgi:hypothetical protein